MAFEYLRPKPKTRITITWGNQLVDALNLLYGRWEDLEGRTVKYSDLSHLGYDIIPDQDAKRSLGRETRAWLDLYAHYGYFLDEAYIRGKRILKDGDPIDIHDIQQPAYEKLETLETDLRDTLRSTIQTETDRLYGKIPSEERLEEMKEDLKASIDRLYGKIAPVTIDEYGRVGVVIYELAQPALNQLLYGTFNVDVLASEEGVADEIDSGAVSPPVTIVTPPPGKRIDTRAVFIATDSDTGEIVVRFKNSGKIVAKLYCSKWFMMPLSEIRITGDPNDVLEITWSGLSAGAKIFYTVRYKLL